LRHFGAKGYYKNTLTLYTLWNKRLVKEETEREVSIIEKDINASSKTLEDARLKIKKLKKEINLIEDEEIVSIGTEF